MRWGILGAGLISRVALVPAFEASERCTVVAVGARDRDRAAALVPGAARHGTYEEVLADPAVEAVYIALANDGHVPWAIEALRAGKHVLCEKPLGLDAAETASAYAAARAAGRLLVEASWYRWHPRTRRAVDIVRDGVIGPVRSVSTGFTFSGVSDDNYRMSPAHGGGSLYDVGCYALSALGWATGGTDPRVTSARGVMSASGVDLTVDARLEVPAAQGVVGAEMRCSFIEAEKQWIEVVGRDATMRFGAPAFTAWQRDATTLDLEWPDGRVESMAFAACDPYRLMAEAVSDRIRGDEEAWVLPAEEARATARALDAVRAALVPAG